MTFLILTNYFNENKSSIYGNGISLRTLNLDKKFLKFLISFTILIQKMFLNCSWYSLKNGDLNVKFY